MSLWILGRRLAPRAPRSQTLFGNAGPRSSASRPAGDGTRDGSSGACLPTGFGDGGLRPDLGGDAKRKLSRTCVPKRGLGTRGQGDEGERFQTVRVLLLRRQRGRMPRAKARPLQNRKTKSLPSPSPEVRHAYHRPVPQSRLPAELFRGGVRQRPRPLSQMRQALRGQTDRSTGKPAIRKKARPPPTPTRSRSCPRSSAVTAS